MAGIPSSTDSDLIPTDSDFIPTNSEGRWRAILPQAARIMRNNSSTDSEPQSLRPSSLRSLIYTEQEWITLFINSAQLAGSNLLAPLVIIILSYTDLSNKSDTQNQPQNDNNQARQAIDTLFTNTSFGSSPIKGAL